MTDENASVSAVPEEEKKEEEKGNYTEVINGEQVTTVVPSSSVEAPATATTATTDYKRP